MIYKDLASYKVVLASQSPRRRHLLKEIGIEYEIAQPIDIDEAYPDDLTTTEVPMYLSELKANAYSEYLDKNVILITADTVVSQNKEIIGKPRNYDDAYAILKRLSGSKHNVFTGVTLTSLSQQRTFLSKTKVFFDNLTDEEIKYYLDNYKPYDKAGSYGIQEWIGYIGVERIKGSFFNVMGLPVHQLYNELKVFIKREG
jgi:septum formation protein